MFDDFLLQPCFIRQLLVGVLRIVFLNGFQNGEALKRAFQIHFAAVVADFGAAAGGNGGGTDYAFGHFHHALVGAEGFVEFHHGEFGIVAGAHAFVAEAAVNFKHALQAADHQPL